MRLFVAVPLGDRARRRLLRLQQDIDVHSARVRWLTEDQLHLTLKFLADVEDGGSPEYVSCQDIIVTRKIAA